MDFDPWPLVDRQFWKTFVFRKPSIGFLYYTLGLHPLGIAWNGSTNHTVFIREMCLNGVNTQWVYSQGVIQKPLDVHFHDWNEGYSLLEVNFSGRVQAARVAQDQFLSWLLLWPFVTCLDAVDGCEIHFEPLQTMGNLCLLIFAVESLFHGFLGGAGCRPSTVPQENPEGEHQNPQSATSVACSFAETTTTTVSTVTHTVTTTEAWQRPFRSCACSPKWLWLKKPVPKCAKMGQNLRIAAVCPSCSILSHTRLGCG